MGLNAKVQNVNHLLLCSGHLASHTYHIYFAEYELEYLVSFVDFVRHIINYLNYKGPCWNVIAIVGLSPTPSLAPAMLVYAIICDPNYHGTIHRHRRFCYLSGYSWWLHLSVTCWRVSSPNEYLSTWRSGQTQRVWRHHSKCENGKPVL